MLEKVTKVNFKPGMGDSRFPVYSKQFNKLVDDLTLGDTDITVDNATVTGDLTVTGTTTLNGALVLGDAAADTLAVNATATYSEVINYSNGTAITAGTTQTMAGATALTEEINNVTVVGSANDGVKLPTASAGAHVYVKNSGANNLRVWSGNASDTIDAQSVTALGRYVIVTPGASISFYAKDAITWESNRDASMSLSAPTTAKGSLQILAADSTGDTVTTITNAAQAAARTYTVPDAGAAASFIMSEGAQTVNGQKTFGSALKTTSSGALATPAIEFGGVSSNGFYELGANQFGVVVNGSLIGTFEDDGIHPNSCQPRVLLGTTPVGTVAYKEYGDGRDYVTELTLTNFVVGALAGAGAALAMGNIVYAFPAGQHLELVSSLSDIVLTAAGTAVATDTGLGSVIASGAVATLDGTPTFEDRLTGQTINTAAGGGAAVSALTAATAGIGTGISLNVAASVKNVFLNSAGTWNVDNTGNLTATGTIVLKWTKMD